MTLLIVLCFWFGQGQVRPEQNQRAAKAQQHAAQSPSPVIEPTKAEQTGNERKDNQGYANQWFEPLVILNTLLFVGILIQAGIYWKQLEKMRSTLGEIRKQGKTLRNQAIGTLSQARFTREALIETRRLVAQNERAVKAAEDSVEIAQRAYVMVDSASAEYYSDTLVTIYCQLMNFGNTPAKTVYVISRTEFRELEPAGWSKEGVDWTENSGMIIAPHSALDRKAVHLQISAEQLGLLSERKLKLYLWGLIRYKDIFGQTRYTHFRLVHHPEQGERFSYCEDGNEAD